MVADNDHTSPTRPLVWFMALATVLGLTVASSLAVVSVIGYFTVADSPPDSEIPYSQPAAQSQLQPRDRIIGMGNSDSLSTELRDTVILNGSDELRTILDAPSQSGVIEPGDNVRVAQKESSVESKDLANGSEAVGSATAISPSSQPSSVMLGSWEFDAEAMRKTAEFRQQIELLELHGYSRRDAQRRAESAFPTMRAMRYVFTDKSISIGMEGRYAPAAYHIISETTDTIVIKTDELEEKEIHTTIRIVDADHLIVSDDSRPDVPVWTFRRVGP